MKKQRQSEIRRALSPNSESIMASFWFLCGFFVLLYIFIKTPILNVISQYVLHPIRDALMPGPPP